MPAAAAAAAAAACCCRRCRRCPRPCCLLPPLPSAMAMQPEHPPEVVYPQTASLKQRADASDAVPAAVAAAAAARAPPELTHVSAVLAPAQVYQAAVDAGYSKSRMPLPKLFLMGITSGT